MKIRKIYFEIYYVTAGNFGAEFKKKNSNMVLYTNNELMIVRLVTLESSEHGLSN